MDKKVIVTIQDLKSIRPLADLQGSRWEQYAVESQDQDLRPILGDGLYYDFMTKVFDTGAAEYADYQLLLNGTSWSYNGQTVYFDGLKPMVSYFTMARFVQNNSINITRYGIVTKNLPQSTPVDQTMVSAIVNELRSSALTYKDQVDTYLLNNVSTYTLYIGSGSAFETSFKFFQG